MLQTLMLIASAQLSAQCELPPTSAPIAPALSSPLSAERDRPPWLQRLRDRVDQRRARRQPGPIDRTLKKFFRSLRHRIAERRAHRGPGLLTSLRDRRAQRHAQADDVAGPGQVTVPHEDPVDLPLYPQPNQ